MHYKNNSDEYFNLVYAKRGSSPKHIKLKKRIDVTTFIIDNIDYIDLLSINDVIIDIDKLINSNKLLCRYLKLSKINLLL